MAEELELHNQRLDELYRNNPNSQIQNVKLTIYIHLIYYQLKTFNEEEFKKELEIQFN